jgi:hypothetical protein
MDVPGVTAYPVAVNKPPAPPPPPLLPPDPELPPPPPPATTRYSTVLVGNPLIGLIDPDNTPPKLVKLIC